MDNFSCIEDPSKQMPEVVGTAAPRGRAQRKVKATAPLDSSAVQPAQRLKVRKFTSRYDRLHFIARSRRRAIINTIMKTNRAPPGTKSRESPCTLCSCLPVEKRLSTSGFPQLEARFLYDAGPEPVAESPKVQQRRLAWMGRCFSWSRPSASFTAVASFSADEISRTEQVRDPSFC